MHRRLVLRLLPGLGVLALLCAAASAQLLPAPPPQYPHCVGYSRTGGGASTTAFGADFGVSQPLPPGMTVAACSLNVEETGWGGAVVSVRDWDPLTLAPDPSAIALRRAEFDVSGLQNNNYRVPPVIFVPPIVTQAMPGVAEPPRQTVTVDLRAIFTFYTYMMRAFFDASGASTMPDARTLAPDGIYRPLPGDHPVLAHGLCEGDSDVLALRVAQSVRHTDTTLAYEGEIAQRFRVPQAVELRWIELAVHSAAGQPRPSGAAVAVAYPMVALVDGDGLPAPVAVMPPVLIAALFAPQLSVPQWATNSDFDHTLVLEPGHDYWLCLRNVPAFQFYARKLTGGEGPAFSAGIGPLYTRVSDSWTLETDRALAFTIVGRPLSFSNDSGAAVQGIRLRVAPNPARDFADVTWSGGTGPVSLQIYDARGRRVAVGEGGAAGTWHWSTLGSRGQGLPGGVYFVRARDHAGAAASEHVVLLR